MKKLRLVVEKNCCGIIAGYKPTNSDIFRWLVYFLREVCALVSNIVMSLQYLFETSTNYENVKRKIELYIICRATIPIWPFGDQNFGSLTKQARARPDRSKSKNKTEKSYQTEITRQTLYNNSPGMETYLPIYFLKK